MRVILLKQGLIFFLISLSACNLLARDAAGLEGYLATRATSFENVSQLSDLITKAGSRDLVLLGEASHGTHEYYHWRAQITKELITRHGFDFIAVEGDWASIYQLNKYVKGNHPTARSARDVLVTFDRWPRWMWANTDVLNLAEWLKSHNSSLPAEERVGFYGMDVYGQWGAMNDLIAFTREFLPHRLSEIEVKLGCFAAFKDNEWEYARGVAAGQPSCFDGLARVINILDGYQARFEGDDYRVFFRARQNALVMKNAESFFRLAMVSQARSWNSRVDHMWQTVTGLKRLYGENSKGIVWAHNTHVGDSRATSMGLHNQHNIGRLSRAALGEEDVFIVGFGTRVGTVLAGREWEAPMQVMNVPEAMAGSLDYYMGKIDYSQFFLKFTSEDRKHPLLAETIGHRAIGVTYDPTREAGNYVPTLPAHRYDAIIFFQETRALRPVE